MGSSNSQPTSKQNYTPRQEMDPAVKQFLQNLNMFTNTVCQQQQSSSGSGSNVNPNTVVFYPVEQEHSQYQNHRCQNPNCQNPNCHTPYSQNPYSQNPYSQNPYAQSPYSQSPYSQSPYSQSSYTDQPDSIIVFQTENYENSQDSLNYGTMKNCWKKQHKYSL